MAGRFKNFLMLQTLLFAVGSAQAADVSLKFSDIESLRLSIYNQNLALVSDERKAVLNQGSNSISFEGVSAQIKPETALLQADGLKVIEQNYEYDLLNYENILEQMVGKEVKTVMTNPDTGKNVFDKAIVLNSNGGNPLLQFSYGVESNFPGRIVFEKIPENLRAKPTLEVQVESRDGGNKNLMLSYLTNGLSWNANYVAEIIDDNNLDLQGWVTIVNNSGTDYSNAKVDLVAGNINLVQNNLSQPRSMMPLKAVSFAMNAADSVVSDGMSAQQVDEYYRYSLPFQTDIMDKQSKQVSLMEIEAVKFKQIFKLKSPMYVAFNSYNDAFERLHPSTVYQFENISENNLGLPLPAGTVRFYDKKSALFLGESNINSIADGEKFELSVGKSFDLFASGKIKNTKKISDKSFEADVEITFNNAKSSNAVIEFEQNFQGSVEIIKENFASIKDKAKTLTWKVEVPSKGEAVLNYTVRVVRN